jgi:hypothetical protein
VIGYNIGMINTVINTVMKGGELVKGCVGIRYDAKAYDCELCGQFQKPIFLKCKKVMEEKKVMAKLLKKEAVATVAKKSVAKKIVEIPAKEATKKVGSEKVVAKIAVKSVVKDADPAGEIWREGTSARTIYDAAIALLKKAKVVTVDAVAKMVKGKFESDNFEGRVKRTLSAAVKREILGKAADGGYCKA